MKQLFILFTLFLFLGSSAFAQERAGDSEETLLEQNMVRDAEQFPAKHLVNTFTEELDLTHPLFIGVDDATIPAYVGNVTTNEWLQAFIGAQLWGEVFDVANDKFYFNSETTL